MSDQQFDIIFRGDIVLGHQIADVKQRLVQLFKSDAAKIDTLFTGAAVPLKRDLDKTTAEKYQSVLLKAGAQVDVCIAGSVNIAPKRPLRSVEGADRKNLTSAAGEAAEPKRAMTLKERLDAAEAEQKKEQEALDAIEAESDPSGLSLAPVGSDVLKPEERPTVEQVVIDTAGLSLKAAGGNLLEDNEKDAPLELAFDFSELDLAAIGEDLLREHEKMALPEVEVIVSDIDLAPVGSDLGQITKAPPPSAPDTSRLSLSE